LRLCHFHSLYLGVFKCSAHLEAEAVAKGKQYRFNYRMGNGLERIKGIASIKEIVYRLGELQWHGPP